MRQRDAAVAPGSVEATLLGAGRAEGQPPDACVEARVAAAGGQPPEERPVVRGPATTGVVATAVALGTGTRATRETPILLVIVARRIGGVTVTGLGAGGAGGVTSAKVSCLRAGTGRQTTEDEAVLRARHGAGGQSAGQPCIWRGGS